jgi:hypothetical protein
MPANLRPIILPRTRVVPLNSERISSVVPSVQVRSRVSPAADARVMVVEEGSAPARRGRPAVGSAAVAFGTAVLIGALALEGEHKFGLGGLALPVGVAALVVAMRRPLVMFCITMGLTLLCEGSTVDLPIMHDLYSNLYGGIEPVTLLAVLTFFSVVAGRLGAGRPLRLPTVPAFTVMLMAFAGVDGVAVAHGAGVATKGAVLALIPVIELILMVLAVYNLDLSDAQIVRLLRWGLAMAAVKAVMGLVIMSLGLSADVDTGTTITYYEPTANWLGLMAVLGLLAAGLGDSSAVSARLSSARERLGRARSRGDTYGRPLVETRASPGQQWAVRESIIVRPDRVPTLGAAAALARWLRTHWGVLGAASYIAFLVAMATLAVQTWRHHAIREFQCFGLASLCAVFGLAAIETTAAFTGVDPRFSVLIGAQFGLLAVLAERRSDSATELVEPHPPHQAGSSGRRVDWSR